MKAQQLKNAILQLAIQGKLVPQDPNDEPASVLLEKIQAEKAKLIAEGKIKKSRKTSDKRPSTTEADFPFEIPESWVWVRLEDICSYIQRGKSPEYSLIKEFPVISQKCVQWSGFDISKAKFINKSSLDKYSSERFLLDNDLLWNSTGLGTLGRVAIYNKNLNPYSLAVVDSHVTIIRLIKIQSDFIYCYLSSPAVQLYIEGKSDGSTKQKELSLKTISNYLIPLPPLNEQKRIVAKLEEILPFIDEYDKKEQKLTALNQQFPEQLKKSILQAAIQGKLVEQDPNDEPASELIKRIQGEKERLISEKKIKKPKVKSEIVVRDNLPYEIVDGVERCITDEVPFEIPESWAWVRLGDIGILTAGKTPSNNNLSSEGSIPYFKVSDMNTIGNEVYLKKTELFLSKSAVLFPKSSIVFPKNGGALLTNKKRILSKDSLVDLNTGVFIPTRYSNINYLYFLFITIDFKSIYKGTALPTLDYEKLNNLLIGIPPLNEQKRIVQKIEELFSYIKHL